jgi:hypothetical protein
VMTHQPVAQYNHCIAAWGRLWCWCASRANQLFPIRPGVYKAGHIVSDTSQNKAAPNFEWGHPRLTQSVRTSLVESRRNGKRRDRFHESLSPDLHPEGVYVGTAASLRAVTPCGLQHNPLGN